MRRVGQGWCGEGHWRVERRAARTAATAWLRAAAAPFVPPPGPHGQFVSSTSFSVRAVLPRASRPTPRFPLHARNSHQFPLFHLCLGTTASSTPCTCQSTQLPRLPLSAAAPLSPSCHPFQATSCRTRQRSTLLRQEFASAVGRLFAATTDCPLNYRIRLATSPRRSYFSTFFARKKWGNRRPPRRIISHFRV